MMAPRTWTEEQKETQRRKMREHYARKRAAAAPSGRDPIPGGAAPVTEEAPPSRGEPRAFAPLPDPEPGVVREPDPTPGTRAKRAAPKTTRRATSKGSSDSELASMLGKLLSAPAVPAAVILKCEFCAAHFAQQAGPTAHELVKLSADSPELRGFLEDLHGYYGKITWAGVIGGYLLKPIAHHVAPNPLLQATHGFLGVPPRPEVAHTHNHAGPAASPFMFGAQPPAAGAPVDGLDLAGMDLGAAMAAVQSMDADELMATAAQFGITVEPSMLGADGPASDSTGQPSESPPAEPLTGPHTGQ